MTYPLLSMHYKNFYLVSLHFTNFKNISKLQKSRLFYIQWILFRVCAALGKMFLIQFCSNIDIVTDVFLLKYMNHIIKEGKNLIFAVMYAVGHIDKCTKYSVVFFLNSNIIFMTKAILLFSSLLFKILLISSKSRNDPL